jgi:hypothetical protein
LVKVQGVRGNAVRRGAHVALCYWNTNLLKVNLIPRILKKFGFLPHSQYSGNSLPRTTSESRKQNTLQSNTTYIVYQKARLHVSGELTNPPPELLYKKKGKYMQ